MQYTSQEHQLGYMYNSKDTTVMYYCGVKKQAPKNNTLHQYLPDLICKQQSTIQTQAATDPLGVAIH